MTNEEARVFLHDNLYSPIFMQKAAQAGIDFDSIEEVAQAQALALRLKQANAVRQAQYEAAVPNVKQAAYAQMNKLASNVLQDEPNPRLQMIYDIATNPRFIPYLDALDI